MKSIRFYAVEDDWPLVFDYLQSKHSVVYTSTNHRYQAHAPVFANGNSIPNLGTASFEQTIACDSYLVTHCQTPVNVRESRQTDGQLRFDIDSLANPSSVRLIHAGRWKDMIIEGIVDTMSDDPLAQSLMRAFSNPMRSHFIRINAQWVGPQAHREWKAGRRLTGAEQSPPEYDLIEN